MLINQTELQTLCLKEEAVQDLAAQVINQLNEIANPIRRYGIANSLMQVFLNACENTGQAAEAFCEKFDIGNDGKHFGYEGSSFNRNFRFTYNYAGNDYYMDEDGNIRELGWKKANAEYQAALEKTARAQKDFRAALKQLRLVEQNVQNEHPNMVPEVVRITFNFNGDATQNTPDLTEKINKALAD